MAVALRNAARLKPEIQLSQALHDFEAILDQDQKAQLDEFKKELPPGAGAPLAFTSFLDRSLQSRCNRRCMGPRVINLLQSAQQFSTVIDVVVGGAQNLLASSVWGILKLSLQIGSNYSQYFDKLSLLLMDIGRTCPQYQQFGSLFAESKGLQRALCEYFAAVIDLCKHIVIFSRKTFIAQLPTLVLPFDAAFSDIQTSLGQLSTAVRDEVALASSKHQKDECSLNADERQTNARFRALATRFMDQSLGEARRTNKHHLQQLRLDFLGRLSNYNHVTAWKQSRSKGTVKWILEEDAYSQWKTAFSSGILQLVGNLGSGKTVLMANVVADLVLQNHVTISYFFCKFDDAASLNARTVIGSLARQLLLDVAFQVSESYSNAIDVDGVVGFLLEVLSLESGRSNIICLDGIDECVESERLLILSALERLSGVPELNLKIIYSTRADTQQAAGQILTPYETIFMSGKDMSAEISEYIQTSLEERLERKQLTLGDPNLILRIQEELEGRANGMYLWIYFQLESLCERETDGDIIKTLEDVPRNMHETYTRILSRIKGRVTLARKIFETIAVAQRPLSTEELREVLAVEPGKLTFKAGSLVNNILKTLAQCGGSLLVVDEEDSTVRFVHESVRQFFTGGIKEESDIAQYSIDTEKAILNLGITCVTYLNLGIFNAQLSKASNSAPWQGISPTKIIKNSLAKDSKSMKLALSLLRGGKSTSCDVGKQLERVAAIANPATEPTYVFLPYAKAYVLTHTKGLLACDAELDSMFYKIFNGYLPLVPKPWSDEEGGTLGNDAISWAVDHNHLGLIYRILRSNASGREQGSLGPAEKLKNVPERVLDNLLSLGFTRQRMDVVHFILNTVLMERDFMMALLIQIIPCGNALLAEWKRHVNRAEWQRHVNLLDVKIPLEFLERGQPARYDIKLKPMVMRYRHYTLHTMEVDEAWVPLALAAASNNVAAVDLMKTNGEGMSGHLDATEKARVLRILLLGLREAACRSHVTMFKHLLFSFPLHLYRQEDSEVSDAEYDEYGWTPLRYAATLPDSTFYQSLRNEYYHSRAFIPNRLLPKILCLPKGQTIPVWKLDPTEKEVVDFSRETQYEVIRGQPSSPISSSLVPKQLSTPKSPPVSEPRTVHFNADSASPTAVPTSTAAEGAVEPPGWRKEAVTNPSLRKALSGDDKDGLVSMSVADESTVEPPSGREEIISPSLSRAASGNNKDGPGIFATLSKRHSMPLRFSMHASRRDNIQQNDFQAQALHILSKALEAQAAVIRAPSSPSTANGKRGCWWENPQLVFLMFVLWPSILLCCCCCCCCCLLVYMVLQRPEQSGQGNGQCVWDGMDL